MKVLLVRPPNRTSMLIPNHGLGYLAAALRRSGHDVVVLDCIRARISGKAFPARLRALDPDVVGFQVYTFDLPHLSSLVAATASACPKAILVAGGPHPSAEPVEFLVAFPGIHFAFHGEGEEGLPMLLEHLDPARLHSTALAGPDSVTLAGIPNLAWRDRAGIMVNQRSYIEDLDALGLPAWDLISPLTYPFAPQGTFLRRVPFAPVIATRGCPYDCRFCGAHPNSGKRLRKRSPEGVVEEIAFLVKEFGVREIHFQDDNFTLNRALVEGVCEGLLKRNLRVLWSCPNGVRLDTLDEGLLKLMEASGCYSLAIGIESGVQRVLDLMKKDLNVEMVTQRVELIRRTTKIRLTGFFVLGFPGETPEEIQQTIRYSLSLDLDKANYGTFMPIPGSAAYYELKEAGELEQLDLGLISEYRSPYAAPGLTTQLLHRELRRAFLSFYLRPKIVARFLGELRSLDQLRIVGRRLREIVL